MHTTMQSSFVCGPVARLCPKPAPSCRPRMHCSATAQDAPVASTSKQQVVKFGSGTEFVIDEDPELKSTWAQRGIVAGASALLAVLGAHGWVGSDNVATAALSVAAGIVFAGVNPFRFAHSHRCLVRQHPGCIAGRAVAPRPFWCLRSESFCVGLVLSFGCCVRQSPLLLIATHHPLSGPGVVS